MKFKVTKKLLSILLLICLSLQVLPTFADATNINSNPSSIDSEARELTYEDILAGNATVDEVFGKLDANTVPDALDYDVAVSRQHIARLYDEESNDLNRVVFLNADGSKTAYIYDYPVKYVNSDGKIKDISLEIKNSSTVGSFETKDNSIVSTFSKNAYDGIRLEGNGESLVLVPNIPQNDTISSTKAVASTEASMAKKTNNKKVSYKYDEKTTIEYSLTYTGFKEDIVVSEYTGQTEYDFTLYTNGLKLVNDNGSFCLKDENNVVKAILGEIIIFTADERNNTWGELEAETIKENEEYKLTIVVDSAFLTDPKTTYPIRIDPTLEICYNNNGAGAISDVTINSNSGSNGTTNTVFIGLRQTYGISRLLMKFPGLDLDEIVGTADITNATVEIRDVMCEADELTIYCYPFTGNVWDESTVTWANVNPDSFSTRLSSNAISYTNGRAQEELYRYKFDITAAVVGWKAGTYNQNKGIIFKSSNAFENGTTYMHKTFASYNYTAYRPSLSITYNESSGDEYHIAFQSDGKMLTTNSTYTLEKTTYSASNSYQKWIFVQVSSGVYTVRMKNDINKCLTAVPSSSTITISDITSGNANQYWEMKNLSGNNALQSKSTNASVKDKKLYYNGSNFTLSNTNYSSVGFIKVSSFVPCTSMSLSSIYVNAGSIKYIYPTCYPSNANITSGWALSFTSSSNDVFTVSGNVITAKEAGIATLTAENKVTGASCSAQVYVTRLPNPDAQNKDKWCWAASSKMVAEHNGGDGSLSTGATLLTNNDGLHTYSGTKFFGQTASLQNTCDTGQRQIVINIYGNDANNTGSTANIETSIEYAASETVTVGTVGSGTALSTTNISIMNNEMLAGRWVVGCIWPASGGIGHAIVITNYDSSTQTYTYWDPWTDGRNDFTRTDILSSTINGNYKLCYFVYCQ